MATGTLRKWKTWKAVRMGRLSLVGRLCVDGKFLNPIREEENL